MFSLGHCPNYLSPPPLLSGNLYIFFGRHKGIYKVYFLIRARPSPPPSFGQCPKENIFFQMRCSLTKNTFEPVFNELGVCGLGGYFPPPLCGRIPQQSFLTPPYGCGKFGAFHI